MELKPTAGIKDDTLRLVRQVAALGTKLLSTISGVLMLIQSQVSLVFELKLFLYRLHCL